VSQIYIIIIIIIIIIIKVQAKAQRIRRYEKRETQYSQNKMFKEETKSFYRNLGMKNIEARESPSILLLLLLLLLLTWC